jgi:membrane protease subunit (stomatin/prohibitin family)
MVLESGLGAIDLQGQQVNLSGKLRDFVEERVDDEFGLSIPEITMNISLPDEITQAMTRGVAKGVEESGYVESVDLGKLQQARAADAMLAAAENEGGSVMGDMMQMGMGVAMAGQMANQMGGIGGQPAAPAGGAPPAGGMAPPPLPGQKSFHVDHGGKPGGPYDMAQMQQGIANGAVTGDTLVWSTGMAAWSPAQTVPELQAIFSAPPPLPPQPAAEAPPMPPGSGSADGDDDVPTPPDAD